jgi:hypothetical protein
MKKNPNLFGYMNQMLLLMKATVKLKAQFNVNVVEYDEEYDEDSEENSHKIDLEVEKIMNEIERIDNIIQFNKNIETISKNIKDDIIYKTNHHINRCRDSGDYLQFKLIQ